jgi:hypothetical protein
MMRRWWPWVLGVLLMLALVFGGVAWASWQHRETMCRDALARRLEVYRQYAGLGSAGAEQLVDDTLRADLARYCGA